VFQSNDDLTHPRPFKFILHYQPIIQRYMWAGIATRYGLGSSGSNPGGGEGLLHNRCGRGGTHWAQLVKGHYLLKHFNISNVLTITWPSLYS
jgi:hypothetical protein